MTHLPYILAAYGLTLTVVIGLTVDALRRAISAQRKLAMHDLRAAR